MRSIFRRRKRKIVVFGNCQGKIVARLLQRVLEPPHACEVAYHFVTMREEERETREREMAEADIVLAQDVRDWAAYPFRQEAEGKTLARFPFLYFAPLWPFDAHQNQADDVALAVRPSVPPHLDFDYHDSLLAKLRRQIPDPEERYRAYRNLDYKRPINLERYLAVEVARLEALDKRYGSSLGRFVIDNFASRRLFHTITHPTTEVMAHVAAEACAAAEIRASFRSDDVTDEASGYQVPLHPLVIKALGISWADETTRYNFRDRQMTFEDYYRTYISLYG